MPYRALVLLIVATALLNGCGRRGSLELPPRAGEAPTAAETSDVGIAPLATPGAPTVIAEPPTEAPAPPRRFLLDFLL